MVRIENNFAKMLLCDIIYVYSINKFNLSKNTRVIWKVLSMALLLHNVLIKCYQIIQIFETKIQRLLDGLNFVEKGLGVHVQRMLKISRC